MTMIATPNGEAGSSSDAEPLGRLLKRASKAAKLVLRRVVDPGPTP